MEIPRAGNLLCAYATIFTHRVTTFIKFTWYKRAAVMKVDC